MPIDSSQEREKAEATSEFERGESRAILAASGLRALAALFGAVFLGTS